MVRTSIIHKIFEANRLDSVDSVSDVQWGSWGEDYPPHVCGICKPFMDEYLVKSNTRDSMQMWPGMICLTCGWVPSMDPNRKNLVNISRIVHGLD